MAADRSAAQTPAWLADNPGWPWALYVGDKLVTSYATKQEAENAKAWYVSTYGAPKGELTVRDLNEATT
jgi:hypothetical protein